MEHLEQAATIFFSIEIVLSKKFGFIYKVCFPFEDLCFLVFQLSKVMKQVRHRLAACQTVREGENISELPGGIWKDVRLTSLITAMPV